MACRGVEALASKPDLNVTVIHHPENKQLKHELDKIRRIHTLGIASDLTAQFRTTQPDLVLCLQGDTTQSIQGIEAAKTLNVECVSYIALAHTMSMTGAKLGRLRDLANNRRINRPDRYITISESMKKLLQDRKTKKPVHVVRNGIPPPPLPTLGQPNEECTIGIIGRLEFKQKNQNFMVQAFRDQPTTFKTCRLLFAGSGPDEKRLRAMIEGEDNMALISWAEDPESIYDRIDYLFIPSQYEGVPLVLLEALARGIPVIGSRTDGIQEILPESWTFTSGNSASLAWAFEEIQNTWPTQLPDLQQKILDEYSLEQFQENFVKAVIPPSY
jgi:glycosyltransferase involved in cell wall biosynthesis